MMKKRKSRLLAIVIVIVLLIILYGVIQIYANNVASDGISQKMNRGDKLNEDESLPFEIQYDGTYMDCPAAHCFIRMSAKPERKIRTVNTDFGPQKLILYSCFVNNRIYGLGFVKLPFDANAVEDEIINAFLDGVKEEIQTEMTITALRSLDLDYAKFAQEYCFEEYSEDINSRLYGKIRIIIAGEFTYYLMTAQMSDLTRADEIDADAWLNSFNVDY